MVPNAENTQDNQLVLRFRLQVEEWVPAVAERPPEQQMVAGSIQEFGTSSHKWRWVRSVVSHCQDKDTGGRSTDGVLHVKSGGDESAPIQCQNSQLENPSNQNRKQEQSAEIKVWVLSSAVIIRIQAKEWYENRFRVRIYEGEAGNVVSCWSTHPVKVSSGQCIVLAVPSIGWMDAFDWFLFFSKIPNAAPLIDSSLVFTLNHSFLPTHIQGQKKKSHS